MFTVSPPTRIDGYMIRAIFNTLILNPKKITAKAERLALAAAFGLQSAFDNYPEWFEVKDDEIIVAAMIDKAPHLAISRLDMDTIVEFTDSNLGKSKLQNIVTEMLLFSKKLKANDEDTLTAYMPDLYKSCLAAQPILRDRILETLTEKRMPILIVIGVSPKKIFSFLIPFSTEV